jgi:hypothetical protein
MMKFVTPACVEIGPTVSDADIHTLAANDDVKTVQISRPPESSIWSRLNERLFAIRPDILLRVYGFYGAGPCDLGFASQMTHVTRFSADSLRSVANVDEIAAIPRLASLTLGIFELDSLAVLEAVPSGLRELNAMGTRSSRFDLGVLARFSSLRKLFIEKHKRNIEVLSGFVGLEDLTLRSVGTKHARYLAPLNRLRDLDLKLGGITDLSSIEGKQSIRYLELWQIRGLSDIGVVSSLKGLQYLFLQSLPHIKALPSLRDQAKLRRIYLENMPGLTDLDALAEAPALEELIHVSSRLSPDDHAVLFRNPAIKHVHAGFGNTRKNQYFEEMLRERGITTTDSKFVFV